MNYKDFTVLFATIATIIACKPKQDGRSVIHQTSDSVAVALKNGDVQKFMSHLRPGAIKQMSIDEAIVTHDVQMFAKFHKAYFGDKMPVPEYPELYNSVGQYVVRFPLYNRPDSLGVVREMHLNIYFGPFKIYSPDQVSGYEIVRNFGDTAELRPLSFWRAHR